MNLVKIKIGNKKINALLSITDEERERGMMGRRFNEDFSGMLFISKRQTQNFWMKNCIIPLDILFIDGEKIVKIHQDCKPCPRNDCKTYRGFGNMVLELEGGYCKKENIREGELIKVYRSNG